MSNESRVNIRVTATGEKQVETAFGRIRQQLGAVNSDASTAMRHMRSFLGLFGGAAVSYVGIRGVTNFLRESVTAAREAEMSQRRVAAVLRATGEVAGVTGAQVEHMAQKYAVLTRMNDEQVRDAAGTLLTFRNVTSDVFEEALSLSIDLAETFGQDLKTAIMQVGRALNDPVLGVTALSRAGITFNSVQREQIRLMTEQGRQGDAMRIILTEMKEQFGGVAEEVNTGLNKSLGDLRKSWVDLQEAMGRSEGFNTASQVVINQVTEQVKSLRLEIERSQTPMELYLRTIGNLHKFNIYGWGAKFAADRLFPVGSGRGASGIWERSVASGSWGPPLTPEAAAPAAPEISEEAQARIDSLRWEQEQLSRTATEQRVLNEVRRAGVAVSSVAGRAIADLVRQIEGEKAATREATRVAAERQAAEDELRRQNLVRLEEVADLEERLLSDDDRWQLAHERRQQMVEAAFEDKLIDKERRDAILLALEEQYNERKLEMAEETAARLAEIARQEEQRRYQSMQFQVSMVSSLFDVLAGVTAGKSKAIFLLQRAAAVASAVVSAHKAHALALANPPGPPWTIPIAKQALAMGYASAATIAATAIGGLSAASTGSGGTVGYGAGTPTSPVVTEPQRPAETKPAQVININVYGNVVDQDKFARELVPSITKAISDGVR